MEINVFQYSVFPIPKSKRNFCINLAQIANDKLMTADTVQKTKTIDEYFTASNEFMIVENLNKRMEKQMEKPITFYRHI